MQRLSNRFQFVFLAICWLLLQAIFLWKFGIFTGLEAGKYIEQANLLLQTGSYESGNFLFYSTQILLIAAALKLKLGLWVVALVQILANAISIFLFYKLAEQITRRKEVAFATTLFFLGMFYYQLYNVYLYTESLFFSFSILYAFVLFRYQPSNLMSTVAVIFLLALLVFTRPMGVLLIPPTLFYFIFRFGRKKALPLFFVALALGFAGFYFLLNAILGSGGELDFLLPFAEEHIICGVPTVKPPHSLAMPLNHNSVAGLWYIISHNSELFAKLAAKRFIAFWGVQRPYYSTVHNLFVAVYFYPVYAIVLLGLKKMFTLHRAQTIFMLSYILLVMLTVLLSCDEWHSRFLYSILPFLLLLAAGFFGSKSMLNKAKNQ